MRVSRLRYPGSVYARPAGILSGDKAKVSGIVLRRWESLEISGFDNC